jgi:integrase
MARLARVLTDVEIRHWVKAGQAVTKSDGAGLTFTLSEKGTAAWVLRYRIGGKQKEVTLGNYPDLTLNKARELAAEKRVEVQQGKDVAQVKQEQKLALTAAGTVAELCTAFFERTVKGRIKRPDLVKAMLDNDVVRVLGKMRIESVKPADVDRMVLGIVKRGAPIMANRTLTITKAVFDFAIRRHWIEYNPASAFNRSDAGGEEKARQRSLSDAEITRLFQAFEKAGPVFHVSDLATRLLLLTAVRKSELVGAAWAEFDLDAALWTIPKERIKTGDKTGKDFTIPIPPLAVKWLLEIKQGTIATDYLFPAKRRVAKKPLARETLNWALGEIAHDLDHFTLHDLRRTARTQLASLGVKPHVAERCLNHRLPGINDTYDTHDYMDERRSALELWAAKLEKLLKGESFNVVPLRKGGAA